MVNKNLKVAVLGAGAMGCLFGGLLAEKGLSVVLIDVWKDHVDEINNKGLKMMGHGGDRTVKIKATTDPKTLQPVDAIIIMCKAPALEKALTNSKNIIGDTTMLMSFQNVFKALALFKITQAYHPGLESMMVGTVKG